MNAGMFPQDWTDSWIQLQMLIIIRRAFIAKIAEVQF